MYKLYVEYNGQKNIVFQSENIQEVIQKKEAHIRSGSLGFVDFYEVGPDGDQPPAVAEPTSQAASDE